MDARDPATTEITVARALARSETGVTASKPCFSTPGRSACPGRGMNGASGVGGLPPSTTLFSTEKQTGLPVVLPSSMPPVKTTTSFSRAIRLLRPFPPRLRDRLFSSRSASSVMPDGNPASIPVTAGPWDSPAV